MKTIIFNGENLSEVYAAHLAGEQVLCPVCRTPLQITLTAIEAKKKQQLTGLFCPRDTSHVEIHIRLSDDVLQGFANQSEEERAAA
jgi:hypothetical protein